MISLFAFVSVVVLIFAGGVIYHGCDRREDKVILWGIVFALIPLFMIGNMLMR